MTTRDKRDAALRYRREWCAWLSVRRKDRNQSACETFLRWYRSSRASWYRAHRWQRDIGGAL